MREISKLIIETDQGQVLMDGPQVPQYMADKYAEIIQTDKEAGIIWTSWNFSGLNSYLHLGDVLMKKFNS